MTVTRLQLIAPSSGSVTVTVYGMFRSPKLKKSPLTGEVIVTVGAVLPDRDDGASRSPVFPVELVTVSRAV